ASSGSTSSVGASSGEPSAAPSSLSSSSPSSSPPPSANAPFELPPTMIASSPLDEPVTSTRPITNGSGGLTAPDVGAGPAAAIAGGPASLSAFPSLPSTDVLDPVERTRTFIFSAPPAPVAKAASEKKEKTSTKSSKGAPGVDGSLRLRTDSVIVSIGGQLPS